MRNILRRLWLAPLALSLTMAGASAQVSQTIDQSLLEAWRLNSGNVMRFCQFAGAPTTAFDQAFGEALAGRLLLESSFRTLGSGYGIDGEYLIDDLYISLVNDCDLVLGMGIGANLYPQEMVTTRPYVGFTYLAASLSEGIDSLSDIPVGSAIGTSVASYGHAVVMRYLATLPRDRRWRALPYGDTDLMLTRLGDGSIVAIVLYGPTMARVLAERSDLDLHLFSLEPEAPARVNLGALMLSNNTYLRTLADQAIASMVADGTIAELAAQTGLEAIPFTPGGF